MKMRSKVLILVCVVLIPIIFLSASAFSRPEIASSQDDTPSSRSTQSFQEYLWLENPVVLLVHVGLILVGALAVSALLPSKEEEVDQ
jgi:preprotein translocase subunit SecY